MLGSANSGALRALLLSLVTTSAEGALRLIMNSDPRSKAAKKLEKLAEEANVEAETTHDPNRKQALRVLTLKYMRLAKFVRHKRRSAD